MSRICSRCLYDDTIPSITFDAHGICNYCHLHDELNQQYPTGPEGDKKLQQIADEIRKAGRGKPYDVVVGVSGGCDSSYMLYLTKEIMGLRPIAAHFDNTWDSTIAVENIQNVLRALDIDLYTYVVDNEEFDDICRSFIKAGVTEIDAPTDLGLATVLYMAAEKYDVRYIFNGHSFRTEGVAPLGWIYMDGKYIESVQKTYGTKPIHSFPNLWLKDFLRWSTYKSVQRIRPLYYCNYQKKEAMKLMSENWGWQWYGGHHLENRFTAFNHYIFYTRFGIDTRLLGHAALVRSGQMSREEGLRILRDEPPPYDQDLIDMVKKRLGFSDEEFETYMTQPRHTYKEFRTYKKTFERLRPLFWLLYKLNRVPKSFYIKYTAPHRDDSLEKKVSSVHP